MAYFLPVFLCFFIAQYSLLGIIKMQENNLKIKKYNRYLEEPPKKRIKPDKLDFEILNQENYNFLSPSINIKNADNLLTELFYKASDTKNQNADEKNISASFLFTSLSLALSFSISFDTLRDYVKKIIETQFYCGSMPDFFKGKMYIMGGNIGFIALPFAVSQYCNYTGDVNFLKETVCYNTLCYKPICKTTQTAFCENIYQHVIRALYFFSCNEYGLIDFCYNDSFFKEINIEKEFADIFAGFFYCKSAEAFLDYISEYKQRLEILQKIKDLRENAVKKIEVLFDLNNFNTLNNVSASILYLLCGGARLKNEVIKKLENIIYNENENIKLSDINVLYQLLYAEYLLKENKTETAVNILSRLKDRELNLLENLFLKSLIINGFLNIEFKFGHIKIKPKINKFDLEFDYNLNKISINKDELSGDGLIIDGLRFNNLDYIHLKGYNKDVNIRL